MIELVSISFQFFNSPQCLLFAMCCSLALKFYTFRFLVPQGFQFPEMLKPWVLLGIVLFGSLFGDIAWLVKLFLALFNSETQYPLLVFVIRFSWGFLILKYQALALFIGSLTEKKLRLALWQKLSLFISCLFSGYFFYIAFFDTNLLEYNQRNHALLLPMWVAPLEIKMFQCTIFYLLNIVTLPSILLIIYKIRQHSLPKILTKNLKIFIIWFMMPYLAAEILIAIHHNFVFLHKYTNIIVGISSILFSGAAYYCLRKVMKFKFLNTELCTQSMHNVKFVDGFKDVLGKLGCATTEVEISHIMQNFFKDAFDVSAQRVQLYIRSINEEVNHAYHTVQHCKTERIVENFINTYDSTSQLYHFVRTNKIVISDEIAFNNFYEDSALGRIILQALDALSADVFLPIYHHETMIAYIIIEKHARSREFFDRTERDQMIVFASYLSNIINLLQNRNLESLLYQEKELREELYNKQQELQQYRESINSFLRHNKLKEVGVLFYNGRRFVFGNQIAKEMVGVNINTHDGHAVVKTLKQIARQVLEYNVSQSSFVYDTAGNKLLISGTPNLERNDVIITIRYPEITDIIKQKIHLLKDPTKLDYLLYLETTESGKLINQLIPGSGEILLNFKIELFKMALNRKALLLNMSEEDVMPAVEILHHISLREYLHILNLDASSNSLDIAIKLFGINPILGLSPVVQPIFEKLNGVGTLFIRNVHHLSLEVQEYLAEFIKYGLYKMFRSDQRISVDVRIICTTDQDLAVLSQEAKFSVNLFNELKVTTLQMPKLPKLSHHELTDLADGFVEQATKINSFKHILELTDRERERILNAPPTSLQELKMKIQQLLIYKSKKTNIYQEMQFSPAFNFDSPDLENVARLGKKALRDPKIMALLWERFKNQTQIATFLGVNRSSVNRRCKDYNLF